MTGTVDLGLLLAVAILALGGLIWLIRLEGRVVAHDAILLDFKRINELAHNEMREEVHYIRMRIDSAINSGRKAP